MTVKGPWAWNARRCHVAAIIHGIDVDTCALTRIMPLGVV